MTDRMTTVQGRCPACGWATLFLGDGGHVTCSRLECPNPSATDELLHGQHVTASTPLVCSDERHAAKVADLERQLAALRQVARGYCPACGRGDAAPTVEDYEQQRQRAEQLAGTLREVLAAFYAITPTGDPTPLGYQAIHPIHPRDYDRWRAVLEPKEQPGPCPACARADQAGLAPTEQHPDCAGL